MSKEKTVTPNNNIAIWDSLRTPPASALKKIGGGRLSGMTDIKPQWRYQIMTEKFGVIGFGWKFTTEKLWTEIGHAGQILAFAKINLFVKVNDVWSDAIEGIGGSTIIELETKGLHSSDEAYKMATTDALSVAMKLLGVGADIYLGLWDGSKYKDTVTPSSQSKVDSGKTTMPPPVEPSKIVTGTALETSFASYSGEIAKSLNLNHLKAIWDAVTASKNKGEITIVEFEKLIPMKDSAKERLK